MVMDYENLFVIVVVVDLNLKKYVVGWFGRVLEIEYYKMEEMRWCLCFKRTLWQLTSTEVAAVNSRWGWFWKIGVEMSKTKREKINFLNA